MAENAPASSEYLESLTWQDVRDAASLELLSARDGKQVDIARLQGDDRPFVRRTHTQDSLREIEQHDLSYRQAWDIFQRMCEIAELDFVPSVVFENSTNNTGQIIVVSELIQPTLELREAPVELKVGLAKALMGLFYASDRATPSPRILVGHNFLVQEGRIVLVDIDPYLTKSSPLASIMDERAANYVRSLAGFMKRICPEPKDYRKTVTAILDVLVPYLDRYGALSYTELAFMNISAESQMH